MLLIFLRQHESADGSMRGKALGTQEEAGQANLTTTLQVAKVLTAIYTPA
jgi:hypothetical protein